MTTTADVAALLRESLEETLAADDTFPSRFYELLFERHPEVRSMFQRHSTGAQHKMFAQKLTALVDHVDDPGYLARELENLGRAHAGYHVTAVMYPWVGEALLETLAEACGERFTPAHRAAWEATYASLTEAILAATPTSA